MRIILMSVALALSTSSAFAANCYTYEEDPNWTISKTADGWDWKQGAKVVHVEETGAGTGVPVRILVSDDGQLGARFMFHGKDMIIDMDVYKPGCE